MRWNSRGGARGRPMTAIVSTLGLLDEEDIIIEQAALGLAALDHPDTDLSPYRALLGALAARASKSGADAVDPADRATILAAALAGEYGFRGDRETYDDPANGDLIRVIDRRRGLPISLSILYLGTARKLGWEAEILGIPSHVLMRIGSTPLDPIIDPFNGGGVVAPERLEALLSSAGTASGGSTASYLTAMPNRAILVRLILNQATRAENAGDVARALTLHERMTGIDPSLPQTWWNRARLELIRGDVTAAHASLGAMLEITRDPALRKQIGDTLVSISGRAAPI